jgi:hypothetical protein
VNLQLAIDPLEVVMDRVLADFNSSPIARSLLSCKIARTTCNSRGVTLTRSRTSFHCASVKDGSLRVGGGSGPLDGAGLPYTVFTSLRPLPRTAPHSRRAASEACPGGASPRKCAMSAYYSGARALYSY